MADRAPYHTLTPAEAARSLDCDPVHGLSQAAAGQRRRRHGDNRLAEPPARPGWLKFLDQFRNLLVGILLVAAGIALLVGDFKDATVIVAVVVLNASLGFWQEHRAESTLAALKGMLAARARVRRDGVSQEIDAAALVPGDVVLLEAGDRVPADGRLLDAHNLEVDEAALTGESLPVGKHSAVLTGEGSLALGDLANLLFMNTVITRGRAELLVTATGMATEMGRLAGMIAQAQEPETPLQQQLAALGKRLAMIAGSVVAVIFLLDFLRGLPWIQAMMTAVALAVAAIPEGLPAVVTVTLALGMRRMAQHRAIVRKLAAVETLGCTSVICSDKTGTLTMNQMTARAGWFAGLSFQASGEGYALDGGCLHLDDASPDPRPLLLPMLLCSESRVDNGVLVGDPTEGALHLLAQKGGLDPQREAEHRPRIAEIPFDSAHKFMATFHHAGDRVEMYVKGAPDVLLQRCSHWHALTGTQPLTPEVTAKIAQQQASLAGQALRVLAVARREIPAIDFDPAGDLWQWAGGWEFVGLAGLMDPPRKEASEAIAHCHRAGIAVKMITGDHSATAAAVARELGLPGAVVSGAELDAMDDATLSARISGIGIFARVAPVHKVRIVQALQARGEVVAMTGDGVNDAPALKAADIGVAMGITGTAVTREAAAMVLTDDNFATIVRAVREGRVIYENIVKFVRFQLSTNIGAVITVLCASLLGWPTPFSAVQLLWINIIMDGPPAMTLGVEPARSDVMRDPPRDRNLQILGMQRLGRLAAYGLTMAVGTLALFQHGLHQHDERYALTLAFTSFVLFQLFNVFNARVEHGSAFNAHFWHNRNLWLALAAVLLLQVMAVHWTPAQALFGTTGLTPGDWLLAAAVASSVLLLDEARKWWKRRLR